MAKRGSSRGPQARLVFQSPPAISLIYQAFAEQREIFCDITLSQKMWRIKLFLMTFGTSVAVLAVVDQEVFGFVFDPVFVVIVLYGGPDGLFGQNGAVDLMGGQPVQGVYYGLV